MNPLERSIRQHLQTARMMAIATAVGDQPWNCTTYFVVDEQCNLYWISKPESRHSQEILQNYKVAVSIPVKFNDLQVIGLQAQGSAQLVEDSEQIKSIAKLYADKFNRGEDWYQSFITGSIPFQLYKIQPQYFVLFDRVNFPDAERQEWKLPILN